MAWSSSDSEISTTFWHSRQMAKANLPSHLPSPQAMKACRDCKWCNMTFCISLFLRRLQAVHHALLHQLVQRAIDCRRMRDAGFPHPVENVVGAQGRVRLLQAGQHFGLIARELRRFMVRMGRVHCSCYNITVSTVKPRDCSDSRNLAATQAV